MDPVSFIATAIQIGSLIIQAGQDIAPFAEAVYKAITSGGDPTQDDWDALHAKEEEMRAILNRPDAAS